MDNINLTLTKSELLQLASIFESYVVNKGDSYDRKLWTKIKSKMKEAHTEIRTVKIDEPYFNEERRLSNIDF